jgi:uncharacterized protein (TIGR02594 family)
MLHWTSWDWIAYGCLGIAAFGLAFGIVWKENPAMFKNWPAIFASPKWSLVPAILFTLGTIIFIFRSLPFETPVPIPSTATRVTSNAPDRPIEIAAASHSVTTDPLPAWLRVALREYDQRRFIGTQSNPRIIAYLNSIPNTAGLNDKVDWASAFAEWSLNQAGIDGPKDMRPRAWVAWGRQVKTPEIGSVVIFNFAGTEHVGFVLADTDDSLIVLGGNQAEAVTFRRYPKKDVIDFRMPSN